MDLFLQTVADGLLKGGLYGLIGIGMTLIMGVMGIINLAHGQIMMVSMYLTYWLFATFGLDPYLSVVFTMPVIFLLGATIERHLLSPLVKSDSILPENQVLMTVGIGMVLTEVARLFFTSDYKSIKTTYSSAAYSFGPVSVSVPLLVDAVVALSLTALLFLFLRKTDVGRSIRATSQDKTAARLMGIDTDKMATLTFAIGSALVAVAGALFLPLFYLYPDIGGPFTRKAFIICILGGLGSSSGAIAGGIILGLAEAFGATYVAMQFEDMIGLVVFLIVLLFLPGGFSKLWRR